MTVWEHLGELRTRLMRVMLYVAVMFVVAFAVYDPVLAFISEPYLEVIGAENLVTLGPVDPVALKLKLATYMAIGLSIPFILFELWGFISPGLTPKERRWSAPFLPLAFVFFCVGVFFGYFTLEPALGFITGFSGPTVVPLADANKYLGFWTFLMLAFGITFQFPIVLALLMMARVVTWRQLLDVWRYAVIGIVAFAAVITPSQDPYSLMLMVVPMVVFYFGAVLFGWIALRNPASRDVDAAVGDATASEAAA